MPIYEYECGNCNQRFELNRRMSDDDANIECPKCGIKHPNRIFSSFSCTLKSIIGDSVSINSEGIGRST